MHTMLEKEIWLGNDMNPVEFGLLEVRESDTLSVTDSEKYSVEAVRRFLPKIGFVEAPSEIANALAVLVLKGANGERLSLGKEYVALGKLIRLDANALRAKLTYYMIKNYERIRNNILHDYGCDIGKEFAGNKNFIFKIATIYYAFVK